MSVEITGSSGDGGIVHDPGTFTPNELISHNVLGMMSSDAGEGTSDRLSQVLSMVTQKMKEGAIPQTDASFKQAIDDAEALVTSSIDLHLYNGSGWTDEMFPILKIDAAHMKRIVINETHIPPMNLNETAENVAPEVQQVISESRTYAMRHFSIGDQENIESLADAKTMQLWMLKLFLYADRLNYVFELNALDAIFNLPSIHTRWLDSQGSRQWGSIMDKMTFEIESAFCGVFANGLAKLVSFIQQIAAFDRRPKMDVMVMNPQDRGTLAYHNSMTQYWLSGPGNLKHIIKGPEYFVPKMFPSLKVYETTVMALVNVSRAIRELNGTLMFGSCTMICGTDNLHLVGKDEYDVHNELTIKLRSAPANGLVPYGYERALKCCSRFHWHEIGGRRDPDEDFGRFEEKSPLDGQTIDRMIRKYYEDWKSTETSCPDWSVFAAKKKNDTKTLEFRPVVRFGDVDACHRLKKVETAHVDSFVMRALEHLGRADLDAIDALIKTVDTFDVELADDVDTDDMVLLYRRLSGQDGDRFRIDGYINRGGQRPALPIGFTTAKCLEVLAEVADQPRFKADFEFVDEAKVVKLGWNAWKRFCDFFREIYGDFGDLTPGIPKNLEITSVDARLYALFFDSRSRMYSVSTGSADPGGRGADEAAAKIDELITYSVRETTVLSIDVLGYLFYFGLIERGDGPNRAALAAIVKTMMYVETFKPFLKDDKTLTSPADIFDSIKTLNIENESFGLTSFKSKGRLLPFVDTFQSWEVLKEGDGTSMTSERRVKIAMGILFHIMRAIGTEPKEVTISFGMIRRQFDFDISTMEKKTFSYFQRESVDVAGAEPKKGMWKLKTTARSTPLNWKVTTKREKYDVRIANFLRIVDFFEDFGTGEGYDKEALFSGAHVKDSARKSAFGIGRKVKKELGADEMRTHALGLNEENPAFFFNVWKILVERDSGVLSKNMVRRLNAIAKTPPISAIDRIRRASALASQAMPVGASFLLNCANHNIVPPDLINFLCIRPATQVKTSGILLGRAGAGGNVWTNAGHMLGYDSVAKQVKSNFTIHTGAFVRNEKDLAYKLDVFLKGYRSGYGIEDIKPVPGSVSLDTAGLKNSHGSMIVLAVGSAFDRDDLYTSFKPFPLGGMWPDEFTSGIANYDDFGSSRRDREAPYPGFYFADAMWDVSAINDDVISRSGRGAYPGIIFPDFHKSYDVVKKQHDIGHQADGYTKYFPDRVMDMLSGSIFHNTEDPVRSK